MDHRLWESTAELMKMSYTYSVQCLLFNEFRLRYAALNYYKLREIFLTFIDKLRAKFKLYAGIIEKFCSLKNIRNITERVFEL